MHVTPTCTWPAACRCGLYCVRMAIVSVTIRSCCNQECGLPARLHSRLLMCPGGCIPKGAASAMGDVALTGAAAPFRRGA